MFEKLKQYKWQIVVVVLTLTASYFITEGISGWKEQRDKAKYDKEREELIQKANDKNKESDASKAEADARRAESDGLKSEIKDAKNKLTSATNAYQAALRRAELAGQTVPGALVGTGGDSPAVIRSDAELCTRGETLGVPCSSH